MREAAPRLLMLAILLLSAGLRFHRLGAQSLWYDEGVAWMHATRSLPELIPLLQRNVHVPAYFAALGIWEDLTGESEFALRSLSALTSLLGIAWVYALGRRLFHPLAGLAAAALIALNSFSIYYAQEARMYAMLGAIAGCGMWLFAGLLERMHRGDRRLWRDSLLLGLVNALGLYTHVSYALLILAQAFVALVWLLRTGRRWRAVIPLAAMFGVAFVLFLPWLPISLRQVFSQPNIAIPLDATVLLARILTALSLGFAVENFAPQGLTVAAALLLIGLRPRPPAWKTLLPFSWALIAIALYLQLELGERYLRFLLPAGLGLSLWLGRGLWILSDWQPKAGRRAFVHAPKVVAAAALSSLLLIQANALPRLFHAAAFQRDDLRGLTRRIESELGANDAVIVSAAGLEEALRYYYRADAPVYGLPTSRDSADTRTQILDIIGRHERLHVIFYGAREQDPLGIVEATLNRHSYEISDEWVDDLRYARYAAPVDLPAAGELDLRFGDHIRLVSAAISGPPYAPGDSLNARLVWQTDAPLDTRYKVFLQLLDAEGKLAAQRDSEPGGGLRKTTDWLPDDEIIDNHGLLLPADLPRGEYRFIAGLYDANDPMARLAVADGDHIELARIALSQPASR